MATAINDRELARRFEALLAAHAGLRSKEEQRLQRVLDQLLPTYMQERKKWAEAQRFTADDFNLLEVLGIDCDEIRHSNILAWLLDPRIEHGTHAQGNLGFRLFLQEFGPDLNSLGQCSVAAYADAPNYWVFTELSGDESRVDVEIASQDRFLIHIENKILSAEADDQTNREWRDLEVRRKELGVPHTECHAIFLTLDGCRARNQNFCCVSWRRIAKVLDRFAENSPPLDVKLFARHYAKAIRKLSAVQQEIEDAEV
jgi:hypothetical protein